ncbi:hypothetical protein ACYJ1Y_07280 [Natrialbaceae archaeon A-gly3]
MTEGINSSKTKPEVYEAFRSGDLSASEAEQFFGDEWEDVHQLSTVEEIRSGQPEPDIDPGELYR